MLTALRLQVQARLYTVPARRKPALRRTDAPDALLATDLPLAAESAAVEAFCSDMAALGWRIREEKRWLLLDAPVPAPQACVPKDLRGECGCCISLLERHGGDAPAEELIRAVVKAAEAGPLPLERLCGQLHGELAALLRRHEPLPGELLPYFCQAYIDRIK